MHVFARSRRGSQYVELAPCATIADARAQILAAAIDSTCDRNWSLSIGGTLLSDASQLHAGCTVDVAGRVRGGSGIFDGTGSLFDYAKYWLVVFLILVIVYVYVAQS